MLHDVLPLARLEADVAAGVLAGLELMLPFKRAEAVIAKELPRLTTLLDNAVADIERIYSHMAALDVLTQPDWEQSMALQALGVERPRKLVSTGDVSLPSVRGRKISTEVKADACATTRYRAASAASGTAVALIPGNLAPLPPTAAPSAFISRALRIWKGE